MPATVCKSGDTLHLFELFINSNEMLKLKRQIRDHYNKHVNNEETLIKIAEIIGYERKLS